MQTEIDNGTISVLRELTAKRKYRKALKVELPQTSKAYTIRGLLYALLGRRSAAQNAFSLALAMDLNNDLARRALIALKRG